MSNPNTLWEVKKGKIRNETIKYTSKKRKISQNIENELKEKIEKLDLELSSDPNNANLLDVLNDKQNQLTNILDIKTSGIILRAKAEWVEGRKGIRDIFQI